MPKNLLAQVRPNIPAPLITTPPNYWETHYTSASTVKLLGCTCSELGFNYDPLGDNFTAFQPFTPPTGATPADVEIFSSAQKSDFEFSTTPLTDWRLNFAHKLAFVFTSAIAGSFPRSRWPTFWRQADSGVRNPQTVDHQNRPCLSHAGRFRLRRQRAFGQLPTAWKSRW